MYTCRSFELPSFPSCFSYLFYLSSFFTFPLFFDRARAVLIAVRRSTVAAAVYFTMSFSSDMQSTTAFSTDGSPRRARAAVQGHCSIAVVPSTLRR